ANVLIDGSGRACLGDFGLASVADPEIIRWTSQSTIASKGGTARWQAPELLVSEDIAEKVYNTKASDVFAWACVCYEIFTNCMPFFEILNIVTVRSVILQGGKPTRPAEDDPAWLKHGLNDRIWELMMDCWSDQVLERPEITLVLSRLSVDKPDDARPAGDWEGRTSMGFQQNGQEVNSSQDMMSFWEKLGNLLSKVVPDV
ncbi:hypothetical protein H0H93_013431, partial [Arthromyces matolae]